MSLPRIFAGRRRRLFAWLVLNGVLQAVCGFGLALGVRGLLHDAEAGRLEAGPVLVLIALGFVLLALRIREAGDAERLGQDYVKRVRLRIFERVARRPLLPGGEERRFGITLTRLTGDLNSLRNWVSVGLARSVVAACSIAGLLVGLAHFSPRAAAVTLAVVAACGLGWALALPGLREAVREARRRRGRLASNLSEKVLAARAVVQLGRAAQERARIRRDSDRLRDALVRRARWGSLLRASPEIVWPLTIVATLAALTATGRPASELVVALLLVGMIVPALSQIARALDHRVAFEEGRRRIEQALDEPRLREARDAVALPGGGPVAVELCGVGVEGVFSGLALRAEAGERVLIVGPTGAGKSTLLGLLARLRDPDTGEVRIDGVDVRSLELDSLHAAVQLVSGDLPLLRGTVSENLSYGMSDEDPSWLERVAEACGLIADPALGSLGLETRIEERGANLPHGLRRRIGLARALAVRPRLLLVDEPELLSDPSALDALEAALRISNATALIVGSERALPSAIDRVWHLPAGVVEIPKPVQNVIQGVRWS